MIPTTRQVEVRPAVSIGIEEEGTCDVISLVSPPGLGRGRDEAPVRLLQEQSPAVVRRAADEHIFAPVAVDITDRQHGSVPG